MSKLFISGGTVIDPETLSRFQADVLCEDGRIAAVQPAQSGAPKDARVIDASGCFVCPGFIDPHGHIDGCKYTGTLSLLQGITTTVGGNCGFSPLDIDAFLRSQTAFPIHQAEMIGLCALLIVFGVLSTVWSHVQDKYLSPVDPADDTEIAFSVETGNSLSRVSRNLESAGLIKNSSVFKYYCDFAAITR